MPLNKPSINEIMCCIYIKKSNNILTSSNNKWMSKWNIQFNMCPTNNKEKKVFVMEKLYKRNWGSEIGRKKIYYINEFNPTCDQLQKVYIGANISWRAKILIAQLRTKSHQLCCETRR